MIEEPLTEDTRLATVIDDAEIARLKDNLDCQSTRCDWREGADGHARCATCGSGFLPSSREFLRRRSAEKERADSIPPAKF